MLVADKLDPDGVKILESRGIEVRVEVGLEPEALIEAARDVDGILVRSASKITADVLAAGDRLKAVGRAGIGAELPASGEPGGEPPGHRRDEHAHGQRHHHR